MAQPTHRYILKWSRMIAPKVKFFGFEREDGEICHFIPGQFITLHIHDPKKDKILHRSYSIANPPGQTSLLEIACSFVEGGVASQYLFNLKEGDTVDASGPVGLFVLKDETPARYILTATGTGITPYRSMLKEFENRFSKHPNLKVTVLLGVRNAEELLFGEEFVNFSKIHPNFEFMACLSREPDHYQYRPFEHKGHVQDKFSEINLNPSQDIIYLCGNPNMIDQSFLALTNQGFDRKNVRREKYLFSSH